MHTTNFINTFIEVAEDCPAKEGEVPPVKGDARTVANIHFEAIINHPYKYTSDDVIFRTYALKNDLSPADRAAREQFFSKGQACMRASPLTKRYGWGVHADEKSRIAIYPLGSAEYKKLQQDKKLDHVKAMRSKRAGK
ncbi:DUF6157 family protein [Chitinophaga lutea]